MWPSRSPPLFFARDGSVVALVRRGERAASGGSSASQELPGEHASVPSRQPLSVSGRPLDSRGRAAARRARTETVRAAPRSRRGPVGRPVALHGGARSRAGFACGLLRSSGLASHFRRGSRHRLPQRRRNRHLAVGPARTAHRSAQRRAREDGRTTRRSPTRSSRCASRTTQRPFAAAASRRGHRARASRGHARDAPRHARGRSRGGDGGGVPASGMGVSYEPIVTVHGEVLHNQTYDNVLGVAISCSPTWARETPEGWAGDVTRVWPVNGRFSPTQRALYEVVLEAQRAAIAMARPGSRYRTSTSRRAPARGGSRRARHPARRRRGALRARRARALFPARRGAPARPRRARHGGPRRSRGVRSAAPRSTRFGDAYLRLDRDLQPGMAVTIEPGLLPGAGDPRRSGAHGPFENEPRSARARTFADVRGIRIEDDVLVTEGEPEVLTRRSPRSSPRWKR